MASLSSHYHQTTARWLLFQHPLSALFDYLEIYNIQFLVLKGWAFVGDLYPDPGQRPISDVDILLHLHDLQAVTHYLERQGFHSFAGNPRFPGAQQIDQGWVPLELSFTGQNGINIDLHTHIMPSPWSLPAYRIDMASVWQESQPFSDWTGRTLQRLGWEHTILHLCTHITRHNMGIHSPQSYQDLDRLVRKYGTEINWQQLIRRANAWHLQSALKMTVFYCQSLLQTPFPAAYFNNSNPSSLRSQLILRLIPLAAVRSRQPIPWTKSIFAKLLLIDSPIDILRLILHSLFPPKSTRYHLTGTRISLLAYWQKLIKTAQAK